MYLHYSTTTMRLHNTFNIFEYYKSISKVKYLKVHPTYYKISKYLNLRFMLCNLFPTQHVAINFSFCLCVARFHSLFGSSILFMLFVAIGFQKPSWLDSFASPNRMTHWCDCSTTYSRIDVRSGLKSHAETK